MKNIKTNLSFCPKVYLVTRMKKPKNRIGVIYLVVLLFLSQVLFGQEGTNAKEKPEPRSETGLYIGFGMSQYSMLHRWELGMDNYYENSLVGFYFDAGSISISHAVAKGTSALWGFGFSLGLRSTFRWVIEPYVGGGLFFGITGREVAADKDNIDKDKDGYVDELGETKIESSLTSMGFKGEVGLRLRLSVLRVLIAYQGLSLLSGGVTGGEAGFYFGIGISSEFDDKPKEKEARPSSE